MARVSDIQLTNKRVKTTGKVFKASRLSTLNAVLSQAGTLEEYKALRQSIILTEKTSTDKASKPKA